MQATKPRERERRGLAAARFSRQHPSVAGSFERNARALLALAGALAGATGGCEPMVTSVGLWQPVVQPEPAPGGGAGGVGGGAGSGGADAEGGDGGAPEPASPGVYFEAESGELSGGFSIGADPAASNGQYIQSPATVVSDEEPGEARASYVFTVDRDADYVIWGRIYSPDIFSNRFWVQVDDGDWHRWRITVGAIWYWDDFHEDIRYNTALRFPLTAGTHQLLIASAAPNARLDRLYVTADGDEPPGNDPKCNPPHSIDRGGPECERSCGSQALPGGGSSCSCAPGVETFYAYDCAGSFACCHVP